jgi:hypothetical protein
MFEESMVMIREAGDNNCKLIGLLTNIDLPMRIPTNH